jgi:UDP-2,3-diacylglucosamine pyrophosphatase LpxH
LSTLDPVGNGGRGPDPGRWGITIVSDLHLSLGCNRGHDAGGHILHDAGFARFLGHVRRRAAEERSGWRLVILGDLVDLPDAEAPPAETITVLTQVAAGHQGLFGAVGEFLAAGMQVEVVAGNHDVALLRRAVRERFADLVLAAARDSSVMTGVSFHPWIYHLPGVLYAEHGSQYHDINAMPALLGLDGSDDHRPAGRPLAAELARHRRRLRERRAERSWPAAQLGDGLESLRFAAALARCARAMSGPELARRRAAYRGATLRRYAAEVGIAHDALVGVDELSVASAWSIAGRLLRTWVLGPAARAAPRLLPRDRRRHGPLWQPADRAAYLRGAWPTIHRLLRAAGQAVPYYVFGHTHYPEELALPDGSARYLNAGTWGSAGSPEGRPAPASAGTFVEITGGAGTAAPVARLLRWNDEAGRPEALTGHGTAHEVADVHAPVSPAGRRRRSGGDGGGRGRARRSAPTG